MSEYRIVEFEDGMFEVQHHVKMGKKKKDQWWDRIGHHMTQSRYYTLAEAEAKLDDIINENKKHKARREIVAVHKEI